MKFKLHLVAGVITTITLLCQTAFANDRYTYSANGTEVTDATTGLTWKRCSEGQKWVDERCFGKATEHNYRGALALGKSRATRVAAWRVPDVDELSTLVDKSVRTTAIDPSAFPDTVSNRYWSSTPAPAEPTQAMIVLFKDGHVFTYHRNNKAYVRLVRNGS